MMDNGNRARRQIAAMVATAGVASQLPDRPELAHPDTKEPEIANPEIAKSEIANPEIEDLDFENEVRHETLQMVCYIEKHGFWANIIAFCVVVAAAAVMPNAQSFVIPVILRIAAMLLNRTAWNRLRAKLAADPVGLPSLRLMRIALFVAGVTWALLLFPMLHETIVHPARVALGGTVIMAIALIFNMFAQMRSVGLAFAGGFFLGFCMSLPWANPTFAFTAVGALLAMGWSLVSFSNATARQKIGTSRALVMNRRLEAQLQESLQRANYLATRDPLTGLLNRRAFFDRIDDPVAGTGERFLMTLDLDHFKTINDVHGHDMGDRVLTATAQEIHALLDEMPGQHHRACRFGGEEFVILVHGIDTMNIYRHAERLRGKLRLIPHRFDMGGVLKVSASIGVARIGDDETIDKALRRSDLAMYRAKDRGRDQVVLAGEEPFVAPAVALAS